MFKHFHLMSLLSFIFIPHHAYNSTLNSVLASTSYSCAKRSLHEKFYAKTIEQCDIRCVRDDLCVFFDFQSNVCRLWKECIPESSNKNPPLYSPHKLCVKEEENVIGSMYVKLMEGSFFEGDILNLFFILPGHARFKRLDFRADDPSASYSGGSSNQYWSHYDFKCATVYKGVFPLWIVYNAQDGRNSLGFMVQDTSLTATLQIKHTEEVNFSVEGHDEAYQREVTLSMPFTLQGNTHIDLSISGGFGDSEKFTSDVQFESGHQISRLAEDRRLISSIRILGSSSLVETLLDMPPVINSTEQFEVIQPRFRILENCFFGCDYTAKWELSFDVNYVCRPKTSFVASLPMVGGKPQQLTMSKDLTFDMEQNSGCTAFSDCLAEFEKSGCPRIRILNRDPKKDIISFHVGETVEFELYFENEVQRNVELTDLIIYQMTGDEKKADIAIGAGSTSQWEKVVTVDNSGYNLNWQLYLDPSLPWIKGLSSVTIHINIAIGSKRRWLRVAESVFRRFLTNKYEDSVHFSLSTDVCRVNKPQGELLIPPEESMLIQCNAGMTQRIMCHANLTYSEGSCESPYESQGQEEAGKVESGNKVLGMSYFIFLLALFGIFATIIASLVLFYCYYVRETEEKTEWDFDYGERRFQKGSEPFKQRSVTPIHGP